MCLHVKALFDKFDRVAVGNRLRDDLLSSPRYRVLEVFLRKYVGRTAGKDNSRNYRLVLANFKSYFVFILAYIFEVINIDKLNWYISLESD
jgi:hypothetical protein